MSTMGTVVRLTFIALLSVISLAACSGGDSESGRQIETRQPPVAGPLLFALHGEGSFSNESLVVRAAYVDWFTDRPERIAGRMSPSDFVAHWTDYGFAADFPNADVIGDASDAVVVLGDARLDGDRLRFSVTQTLSGDLGSGDLGAVSLFIDPSYNVCTMEIENQSSNTLTFQTADPAGDDRWSGGPVATILPNDYVSTNFRYQSNTERKTGTLTYPLGGGHMVTLGIECRWHTTSGSEVVNDTCDYSPGSPMSCSSRITADKNDAIYTVTDPPGYCPWSLSSPGQLADFSGEIHCQEATQVADASRGVARLDHFTYNGVQWYWAYADNLLLNRQFLRVDGAATFMYFDCNSPLAPPCQ